MLDKELVKMANTVECMIEIPQGSRIKYEWNRKKGAIVVDRILRDGFTYPCTYGFIPQTLDWDGDELDVLIFSSENFQGGVLMNVRVVGALKMEDEGETDTKLLGVHADDNRLDQIQTLKDLPLDFLNSIEFFFSNYKNWKRPGATKTSGFETTEWALEELKKCKELFREYGWLPKIDFVEKMKKEHPEKYNS